MRIAKAAEVTGLSKKSIQMYIERELVSPLRDRNGYYNFRKSDIERLNHIMALRALGLGLTQIKLLYTHPEAAILILTEHKYRIHRQLKLSEVQLTAVDSLMNTSLENPTRSIGSHLNLLSPSQLPQRADRPIDDLDAELISSYFWTLYIPSLELSDFQLYLWAKLKKLYMESNSEELKHYRNRIVSQCGSNQALHAQIESIVFYRNTYFAVSQLCQENIFDFVSQKCMEVEKSLASTTWVESWIKAYQSSFQELYAAYAEPFVNIMLQFSETYASFYRNIEKIILAFRAFYASEEGFSFRHLIQTKLKDAFTFNNQNDIIQLLFFTPEMFCGI